MDSNIFYAIIDAANHLTNNPTANEREHPDDVARIEQMIGADPDLVHAREEFTEETPLHKAAGAFVPTVAELLLCHGADVNALAQTSTPLQVAIENEHEETELAVKVVDVLIRHGADVNYHRGGSSTLLYIAARTGKDRIARRLLDAGASVDLNSAVYLGRVDTARASLQADPGAIQNACVPNALIADALYHYREPGVEAAMAEMVALLLEHGLNPNAPTVDGPSPLLLACNPTHAASAQVVQMLLDRGAEVNAVYNGRTALDRANEGGNQEIINLLKQRGAKSGRTFKKGPGKTKRK